MKSSEIAANVDNKVIAVAKDGSKHEGTIIGYTKGWVEVEIGEDVVKCRAKQLELCPNQEVVEVDKGEEYTEDPLEASSKESGDDFEAHCPSCDNIWTTPKTENLICPKCKNMFRVRLHPNKDDYIIGLSTTESGRDTMDINDDTASLLRGMPIEEVYEKTTQFLCDKIEERLWFSKSNFKLWKKAVEKLEEEYDCHEVLLSFLWKKYAHLNLGMQRMNLGNLLRGAIKRQNMADAIKS